jgi:hypothetical protein
VSAITAAEVRIGDRLRTREGLELTVTRIDEGFLGMPGMMAFVEDSEIQWLKLPAPRDGEVDLLARGDGEP